MLPVFVLFFIGWKLWHKTKWVKLSEMDIHSGRRELEDDPDPEELPRRMKHGLVSNLRRVFVG